MERFYAVLAVEVLVIVAFGFTGGVVSVLVALTLVVQARSFMVARRSND